MHLPTSSTVQPYFRVRTIALCALMTLTSNSRVYAADKPPTEEGSKVPRDFEAVGMTVPSKVATLASVLAARIARIPAVDGSVVSQGDLVIALDDGVQVARTEIARAAAESSLAVDLAKVGREHARREWDRLVALHGDDHASSKELSDALAHA